MDICDLWDADIWINPTLIWINPNWNGLGIVEKKNKNRGKVLYTVPHPRNVQERAGVGWGTHSVLVSEVGWIFLTCGMLKFGLIRH